MKLVLLKLLAVVAVFGLISFKVITNVWYNKNYKSYTVYYTAADKDNLATYNAFLEKGQSSVKIFFGASYSKTFRVLVHPSRNSLDTTWQKDWGMPQFKSECWMVASGVADKLDLMSPKLWDKQACEHSYSNKNKTQQLITHELVHVYHGQLNKSTDFSNVEGIDWFVEGLATYASGQCDSLRRAEVKAAISNNKIPTSLDAFWNGKLKYGLSGSMVMFIDHKYGRAKLKELLPLSKKTEILNVLTSTEEELLNGWKEFIIKL